MGDSGSALFSVRWSTRVEAPTELTGISFNSHASGGSRVKFDKVTVLDAWDEFGSTFSVGRFSPRATQIASPHQAAAVLNYVCLQSEPVVAGQGFHTVAFEYRSAETIDAAAPTNSYAQLSWSGFNATTELAVGLDDSLFADVAWLAVSTGVGAIHGVVFEAGVLAADSDFVVDLVFGRSSFGGVPPHLFGGYMATDSAAGGHLRLVDASATGAAIAVEFDSCDAVITGGARVIGWLALASSDIEDTRFHQQPTFPSDVAALLAMASELRLPDYLRWRNGSDPCRDRQVRPPNLSRDLIYSVLPRNTRWVGVECRSDDVPRVIVVDIVSTARAFLFVAMSNSCLPCAALKTMWPLFRSTTSTWPGTVTVAALSTGWAASTCMSCSHTLSWLAVQTYPGSRSAV